MFNVGHFIHDTVCGWQQKHIISIDINTTEFASNMTPYVFASSWQSKQSIYTANKILNKSNCISMSSCNLQTFPMAKHLLSKVLITKMRQCGVIAHPPAEDFNFFLKQKQFHPWTSKLYFRWGNTHGLYWLIKIFAQ